MQTCVSPNPLDVEVKQTTKRISAVELFVGAGGLSLGLKQAGFDILAAVEYEKSAVESYSRNIGGNVLHAPVQSVCFRKYEGVDLLAGGPPCQPWSTGGLQKAASDERDLLPEYARALDEIRPAAFLLENVAGLVSPKNMTYFQAVLERFRALGYNVSYRVLNCADYGVPQKRLRSITVGVLRGNFSWPFPTHGRGTGQPWVTAGQVICKSPIGIPNNSPVTYAKRPCLRPSAYAGQLWNGGGRPVNLSEPSPTILASCGGNRTPWIDCNNIVTDYHRHLLDGGAPRSGKVLGARRLTVQECALLQSFPAGYQFFGAKNTQYRQVGNAVPPRLAYHIGLALKSALAV